MSPSQVGGVETTGPVGVSVFPQLSVTVGGVGTTISAIQSTVSLVGGIAVNGSNSTVTVCTYCWELPSHSVYVQAFATRRSYDLGVETTGPVGVSVLPQLSVTVGGVGTTISAIQSTVALVGGIAGNGSNSTVTVCTYCWELPSQSVYVQV